MDENVKNYIEKQASPQKEILLKLREIIVETIPEIKEEFKMGVPWYENKFYLVGLKDHVNIGFSLKSLSKEEIKLFEGNGKTMRHIKVFSTAEIDRDNIMKLLNLVWEK